MKRLCSKLAGEARQLAAEIVGKVSALPEGYDPPEIELQLRDAIASLRQARNMFGAGKPAPRQLGEMVDDAAA